MKKYRYLLVQRLMRGKFPNYKHSTDTVLEADLRTPLLSVAVDKSVAAVKRYLRARFSSDMWTVTTSEWTEITKSDHRLDFIAETENKHRQMTFTLHLRGYRCSN